MAEALDIKDKKERNWVRVAYGFKFMKNGLASFIDNQIHQQHHDLICCLETDLNNPAKRCTSCSSENLLPNHHTRSPCIQRCKSNCFCSTWHNRRKCPNQFCSRFYDKIVREHAEGNPSWQNTDPSRWDHWELAKCFLGTTGYLTIHSASETDVTGLLSIAINDLFVVHKIDNLDNFKQMRKIRNDIFHKKMLDVTDDEANLYIECMIAVLQDKLHLLHDAESQQAAYQLNMLKQNQIYISTEDADELRKNALDTFKSVTEKYHEFEENKKRLIREISLKTSEIDASKSKIEEIAMESIREIKLKTSEIEAATHKSISEIEEVKVTTLKEFKLFEERIINTKSSQTQKTVDDLGTSAANMVKSPKGADNKISLFERLRNTSIFTNFDEDRLRSEFKAELVLFYKKCESMIPASPLVENHVVRLTELYVQPPMSAFVKPNAFGQGNTILEKKRIFSYRELFFKEDKSPYTNIYVEANAGCGKTSFTQKLAMTWCEPNKPKKNTVGKFVDDDTLKRFDLLFLLHLRDFQDEDMCLLDELIIKFVARNLPEPERFSEKFIKRMLRSRPCLIVCDGLDEWAHPSGKCVGKPGIPHSNYGDNCTVLTTTRPWKLSKIGLTQNHIDRHVEISLLDEATSKELKSNAVKLLSENSCGKERDLTDFDKKISSVKIGDIRLIPYILLQLICIWFDDISIGKSKCETVTLLN